MKRLIGCLLFDLIGDKFTDIGNINGTTRYGYYWYLITEDGKKIDHPDEMKKALKNKSGE